MPLYTIPLLLQFIIVAVTITIVNLVVPHHGLISVVLIVAHTMSYMTTVIASTVETICTQNVISAQHAYIDTSKNNASSDDVNNRADGCEHDDMDDKEREQHRPTKCARRVSPKPPRVPVSKSEANMMPVAHPEYQPCDIDNIITPRVQSDNHDGEDSSCDSGADDAFLEFIHEMGEHMDSIHRDASDALPTPKARTALTMPVVAPAIAQAFHIHDDAAASTCATQQLDIHSILQQVFQFAPQFAAQAALCDDDHDEDIVGDAQTKTTAPSKVIDPSDTARDDMNHPVDTDSVD